ncbi:GGDEF domain-containing protein [Mycolicibacterium helvum]|uniref:Diguanylate cyclase n=1 Tax=Mycolicibacterium helvum TaxID=1534349 RepID=A0A7I7TAE1_9MYCO|nr:diguanylate cyclase [Mycolicibacterium helvum]BBY65970.1 hypothetical protein MHEL_42130 [Mycolicibacterium helvum]
MEPYALPPFAGLLVVDRDCVVVDAEPTVAVVLGLDGKIPLVGSRLDEVLDRDVVAQIQAHFDIGCPHGAVFDRDGLQFIVRSTSDPARVTIAVEDVGGRQAAWHRFQLTQATIDRVADMIIWLDPDGRYVYVNPAATALLGYSAEELSRLRVVDVDPQFDEQRWREHWQDVVERGSFTLETVNTTKSGVEVPIEVTVNYVEHEGAHYNCSIVRDITERKLFESRLLQLNEKITQLSITDDLTGIANRRHLDAVLAEQIDIHLESAAPLSVIMLDVDYFKAFNDRYGHTAGDECLRSVAGVVASIAEESGGTAARYGGEEFLCLLPATDEESAQSAARRIQQSVVDLGIPHAASEVAETVTVSLGVLTARDPLNQQDVLAAVDSHLYRAKREGRNRIVAGLP